MQYKKSIFFLLKSKFPENTGCFAINKRNNVLVSKDHFRVDYFNLSIKSPHIDRIPMQLYLLVVCGGISTFTWVSRSPLWRCYPSRRAYIPDVFS